jgi:hypothetical protein
MSSSNTDRIANTNPEKQKEFVLLVAEALGDPTLSKQLTKNNLDEAMEYITKLQHTNYRINEASTTKIIKAILPDVPTHPAGYTSIPEKQREFLNSIKPKLNSLSKRRKLSLKNLNEADYYAKQFGNKNVTNIIFVEKSRRVRPPFRIPESDRPDMPPEALIPADLAIVLLNRIWNPVTKGAEKQEAYSDFVDYYLTDWVNRKGFVKNGVQMRRTPLFDDYNFITSLQKQINELLMKSEEKPNPKTLNKRPGNSIRQQLLKDLYEKVSKRRFNLLQERLNKFIESEGGRRRTRKRKHIKRRHTRSN